MPEDIHWEPVPWHGDPKAPNEHEVLAIQRAAHAEYAKACGNWTSYFHCWDPQGLDGWAREHE